MKKTIITIFICLVAALTLTGCSSTSINVNVEDDNFLNDTVFGKSALIEIGDYLWYDKSTQIVYWWNGILLPYKNTSTAPSPYYAPNGLPYRYDPETNTFEEIQIVTKKGE